LPKNNSSAKVDIKQSGKRGVEMPQWVCLLPPYGEADKTCLLHPLAVINLPIEISPKTPECS